MIRLFDKDTDMTQVERIARILKDGGLVICPTDTVYAWVL